MVIGPGLHPSDLEPWELELCVKINQWSHDYYSVLLSFLLHSYTQYTLSTIQQFGAFVLHGLMYYPVDSNTKSGGGGGGGGITASSGCG